MNNFVKQAILFRISKFDPSRSNSDRQREAVEYLLVQILGQKQGIILLAVQKCGRGGAGDEQRKKNAAGKNEHQEKNRASPNGR